MNVHRSTDKTRTRPVKQWEPIDRWLDRWEKAHDPGCIYGAYGKDPANVIVKVVKAA